VQQKSLFSGIDICVPPSPGLSLSSMTSQAVDDFFSPSDRTGAGRFGRRRLLLQRLSA